LTWFDPLGDRLVRFQLRRCAAIGRSPRVEGRLWIRGPGRVFIGDRVRFAGLEAPIELHAVLPGAEIHIADDVVLCGGTSIEAQRQVVIGRRCRLGPFTKIMDTHFHPLRGDGPPPPPVPITLEEEVQLGARSILLPGACLQRGARVCADTVVSRPVPPSSVVAGVPARMVWVAGGEDGLG
jgi:acetyltransferase-like isoleucine patch superfamily enzyme